MSYKQEHTGQGLGIEGRYAGLPDDYASKEKSKIVIQSIPFDKTTTYGHGTDKGPAAIIEASRNLELYDIETDSEVFTHGIYTAPAIQAIDSETMLKQAYEQTLGYLKKDKCIVTIGGEHSISFAPIKAHADHYKELTILQLDAHADLQKSYEGNPWSHACVMARVKELQNIKRIVSIGIRSMSSEELPLLNRETTFFSHQIYNDAHWIDNVLYQLQGPIYITFDLDVFDSSLMPSTGTPEPGGLQWNETLALLKRVIFEKDVVGLDVVELCPNPHNTAPDYLTAKLIYKYLSYKFHKDSR